MKFEFLTDISKLANTPEASCTQWNQLNPDNNPFCRYEFLAALETSGCCNSATGWQPQHIVIRDHKDACIALLPSYLKTNSNGEYVFDWAWADAYQRNGLNYYPKLLSAIPFTPSAGPRILTGKEGAGTELLNFIHHETIARLSERELSSWHILFPDNEALKITCPSRRDDSQSADAVNIRRKFAGYRLNKAVADSLLVRHGIQFQWRNRGYSDFTEFLSRLTSRKRKNIRKERQQVASAGVLCRIYDGKDIDEEALEHFYLFYQLTYLKRGQRPYLNRQFFRQILETMPDQIKLVLARHESKVVAGSLFFTNHNTLFGRYWGCTDEFRHLHFECCYYQGIDYAIQHQLERFDAGAQGEHKILRGFEPVLTYSLHWIDHPGFRTAIADFVDQEQAGIKAYMLDAKSYLPFKKPLSNNNFRADSD
jgi:uncharacterized protein